MGYKQRSGPLQRAGYDKDATSPFRQETDSTSGVDYEAQKQKIRDVIGAQRKWETDLRGTRRHLAEIDSLDMVERGESGKARQTYGDQYTYKKSLKQETPLGSGPNRYNPENKEKMKSLTKKAIEQMRPRPSALRQNDDSSSGEVVVTGDASKVGGQTTKTAAQLKKEAKEKKLEALKIKYAQRKMDREEATNAKRAAYEKKKIEAQQRRRKKEGKDYQNKEGKVVRRARNL